MKITVYTIHDCPFCKQEKEYLNSHSLTFEEKSLESNKEFLTEMLAISNNFAGAPVTKVEKDDGQIAVLRGFTQDEFDKTLGFGAVSAVPEPAVAQVNAQMTPPPVPLGGAPVAPEPTPPPTIPETPPPTPPVAPEPVTVPEPPPIVIPEPEPPKPVEPIPSPMPPVSEAQSQMTPPPVGGPVQPVTPPPTPVQPNPQDEALNSILNDLQKKVNEVPAQPQTPPGPVV